MKTFFFILILFSALLTLVAVNYIYMNKISLELLQKANTLKCDASSIESLISIWESDKDRIGYSVGSYKIREIDDLLDTLLVYAEFSDGKSFEATRAQLINALSELDEFESFGFSNIFR